MPRIELTLLVGRYAQLFYLGRGPSMTDTVAAWRDHPQALANYQARGMKIYKVEEK